MLAQKLLTYGNFGISYGTVKQHIYKDTLIVWLMLVLPCTLVVSDSTAFNLLGIIADLVASTLAITALSFLTSLNKSGCLVTVLLNLYNWTCLMALAP